MTDHVYLEPMNKGTNSENYYSTIDELKTPVLPKPSSPEDTSKEVENYYSTIDELKTPVLPKHSPHELPTKQKSTKYIIIVFLISLLLTTAAVFIYLFINRIIGAASGQILREGSYSLCNTIVTQKSPPKLYKTNSELIPKTLCRSLAGCICSPIDENRYNCTCPKGTKCLLLKGPPKIYVDPTGPYDVAPGGGINISCTAVAHPFPEIYWQQHPETVLKITNLTDKRGATKSEQILTVKELHKNSNFTCHANNSIGKVERTVHVVVTGPGSAPILRAVQSGRTSITVRWEPPQIVNRPITGYTIYYTNNGNQPIKNWKKIEVVEPNREQEITELRPNTAYFIRVRANDPLGPGRLGNPVSVTTLKPAAPPVLIIEQGEEIRVAPLTPFFLGCNVTQADPTPVVSWQHKGRPLSAAEKGARITIQHVGLLENTVYTCIAENEAGTQEKSINVIITGPSAPERIRYQIDGNAVKLQWEDPRITNGPMTGFDVLYSDDQSLPLDQWKVHHIDDPNNREARIDGLDEKKRYNFVIRGQNQLGIGIPTSPFEALTWLAPRAPSVTVDPSGIVEKSPSQDELSFECEARGVPRPKILWLWSGQLVEDGRDEFRVYDTTPIDAQDLARSKLIAQSTTRTGAATCQAVNTEGSDEKKTEVKIKGPGSAPINIHPVPMHNGKKVAVISIAGAFRKGKSFLLNFLVTYLEWLANGGEGQWFDEDTILDKFHWRGGIRRDTNGIYLWNRPYIMTDKDGEEVVVLLMDTQGTFDHQSTVQDCATIFAISTLLSSVQIFNISQQIQEDDLNNLRLFAEYAQLAKNENDEHQAPFQKLLFLIRDWPNSDEHDYGYDGGQEYLDKLLMTYPKQKKELKQLRKNLESSFETLEAFLMPHPGLRFAKNFSEKILGEVEPDFSIGGSGYHVPNYRDGIGICGCQLKIKKHCRPTWVLSFHHI